MANFNHRYQSGYRSPLRSAPSAPISSTIVSKLLQSGLAQSVEQIVRKQVEQLVGGQPQSPIKRDGHGQRTLVGTEKLEPFDPDVASADVALWLIRFDELGERYDWSDFAKMYLLKSKVQGRAREWYTRVDLTHPDYLWDDWKKEMWMVFTKRDFGADLEELVARRKSPDESLLEYFHSKMALCERCKIGGSDAVSCLIRGLPEELRPAAYSLNCLSPETLLSQFVEVEAPRFEEAGPAKKGRFSPPSEGRFESPDSQSTSEEEKDDRDREPRRRWWRKKRCYNCQEYADHLSQNCPKPKVERCISCGKPGHQRAECWKGRSNGRDRDSRRSR